MVQERQDNTDITTPIDETMSVESVQDPDVTLEMDDTSAEVLRTVEWPNFLKRILWYLDTQQAGAEVTRLDKLRAANDSNTEAKKAA